VHSSGECTLSLGGDLYGAVAPGLDQEIGLGEGLLHAQPGFAGGELSYPRLIVELEVEAAPLVVVIPPGEGRGAKSGFADLLARFWHDRPSGWFVKDKAPISNGQEAAEQGAEAAWMAEVEASFHEMRVAQN